MIDKILNLLDEAKNNIKQQAEHISATAKNQYEKVIEDWLQIIPNIVSHKDFSSSISEGVRCKPRVCIEHLPKLKMKNPCEKLS